MPPPFPGKMLPALAASLAIASGAVADPAVVPAVFLPADDIPDLTQTDPEGRFAGGGRRFCGPVAVSNSLVAMFRDDLREEGLTQHDLVKRLASIGYMNTQIGYGTRVTPLMCGVERFLRDHGIEDYSLKFRGYREHERRFSAGSAPPRLDRIKATLHQGGAVWLMVGWYTFDRAANEYTRVGGHWVTAVGYGCDKAGRPHPGILVIHDPATRAGARSTREHVVMTRLTDGILQGVSRNRERPARGMYRMEGGMHVKRTADCAILDGAVCLRIPPAAPRRQEDPFFRE